MQNMFEKISLSKFLLDDFLFIIFIGRSRNLFLDFFNSKKKKIVPEEEDPDLFFLKSLLPDMKSMNDNQKRRFKMQMISVAESILSEP